MGPPPQFCSSGKTGLLATAAVAGSWSRDCGPATGFGQRGTSRSRERVRWRGSHNAASAVTGAEQKHTADAVHGWLARGPHSNFRGLFFSSRARVVARLSGRVSSWAGPRSIFVQHTCAGGRAFGDARCAAVFLNVRDIRGSGPAASIADRLFRSSSCFARHDKCQRGSCPAPPSRDGRMRPSRTRFFSAAAQNDRAV